MIIMRFDQVDRPGHHDYFAGSSEEDVLKDTDGGTQFGHVRLACPHVLTEEEMAEFDETYLAELAGYVRPENTLSFWMRSMPAKKST